MNIYYHYRTLYHRNEATRFIPYGMLLDRNRGCWEMVILHSMTYVPLPGLDGRSPMTAKDQERLRIPGHPNEIYIGMMCCLSPRDTEILNLMINWKKSFPIKSSYEVIPGLAPTHLLPIRS